MSQWTQKRRLSQSKLIFNWKPWEKSTGAKSEEGKAKSKMNAYKHGRRAAEIRTAQKMLAEYRRIFRKVTSCI